MGFGTRRKAETFYKRKSFFAMKNRTFRNPTGRFTAHLWSRQTHHTAARPRNNFLKAAVANRTANLCVQQRAEPSDDDVISQFTIMPDHRRLNCFRPGTDLLQSFVNMGIDAEEKKKRSRQEVETEWTFSETSCCSVQSRNSSDENWSELYNLARR